MLCAPRPAPEGWEWGVNSHAAKVDVDAKREASLPESSTIHSEPIPAGELEVCAWMSERTKERICKNTNKDLMSARGRQQVSRAKKTKTKSKVTGGGPRSSPFLFGS